jgi:hypothetical protein
VLLKQQTTILCTWYFTINSFYWYW